MAEKSPSKSDQVAALRIARANRRPNAFEDAARGRDPALKSSDGGGESRPAAKVAQQQSAGTTGGRRAKIPAVVEVTTSAGVAPGPSGSKPKRATRGTFDRNAYMREYMRRQRAAKKD